MKYDIFISYRREGGFETAKLIQERLKLDGYRVFFDFEGLRSGKFNTRLYQEIESCKDFIVILSENSLDRCVNPKDWFRLEILHALKHQKNIIPVISRNFEFPSEMPEGMEELGDINGIKSSQEYFDATYKRLKVFLKADSIKKKRLVYTGIVLVAMIIGYFLFTNVIPKISKIPNDSTLTLVSISKSDTIPNEQDTLKQVNKEKPFTSQPKAVAKKPISTNVAKKPISTNNKFINFTETAENVNIEMVAVKGGTFNMGSNDGESIEKPVHQVTVSDFYMGKYEVTFAQYDVYCEATGKSKPNDSGWGRGNRPVINVSWFDSDAYCKWLSQKTGKTYRLPTEAEWEYAARAGATAPFNTGNCLSTSQANYDGNYPYTGCSKGEYTGKTLPVGSFSPNAWGLFDMHGNVWEWCSDWYDAGYYANSPRNNPPGGSSGAIPVRVLRGGSWYSYALFCRVSYRSYGNPDSSYNYFGFRLVLVPD